MSAVSSEALSSLLARHLRPGALVAIGDGAGSPWHAFSALADASREVGGIELLLGWSFRLPELDWSEFSRVRSLMGGHAMRPLLASGIARYVPARYGSLGPLLSGPLRPDVVVVAARPSPRGLVLGTEVSWLGPAIENASEILVELNHGLPDATRGPILPSDRVTVLHEVDDPPLELPSRSPSPALARIGESVAAMLPRGCTLQVAPGGIGAAVLAAVTEPVAIDSGVVTDDVVELDRRGLLRGTPLAAYAMGTRTVYEWADGRPMLASVGVTHDISRLASHEAFVAVNTALEIDHAGQVNVEAVDGDVIGGIGGHADYALGASRCSGGLSIVALASTVRGQSALVERLQAPTTTPRSDVDVVVTEHGWADLRGLDDTGRRAALRSLFPG